MFLTYGQGLPVLFHFSIGEIMIYTGIIVVIGLVVLIILGLFPLKKK